MADWRKGPSKETPLPLEGLCKIRSVGTAQLPPNVAFSCNIVQCHTEPLIRGCLLKGKHFEKRAALGFLAQIEPIRQSCLPLSLREWAFSSFSPGGRFLGKLLALVKAICHIPCLLSTSSDFWFLTLLSLLFWHFMRSSIIIARFPFCL